MSSSRFSVNESLWVRGETIDRTQRNARSENEALRARGARLFMLKGRGDAEGLAQLQRRLRQSDEHVILARLLPAELRVLRPLLRERRNFSIVVEDWWSTPDWFLRMAEYVLFRNYSGIAVRLGRPFLAHGLRPPVFFVPQPPVANYHWLAAALRIPALAVWPLVDLFNHVFRRGDEPVSLARLLYFPFPVNAADVPLTTEKLEYDFANTGGTCGIWLMRDPRVSFRYTFANLYHDRQRLADGIALFEGKPFAFYDCRREPRMLTYDEYVKKNRQSRYLIATGGLQDTSVPKYLEYACVGTPMIGRKLPFEYPWLDECLFEVDIMRLTPGQLKPLLHQAIERYPEFRANCLNWRGRLLELYNTNRLLDVLQSQADGKPMPPGYLKVDLKTAAKAQAEKGGQPVVTVRP